MVDARDRDDRETRNKHLERGRAPALPAPRKIITGCRASRSDRRCSSASPVITVSFFAGSRWEAQERAACF